MKRTIALTNMPAGEILLDHLVEDFKLAVRVFNEFAVPKHHHARVVDGVVHRFSGVNQPVGQSYGNVNGLTAGQLINGPAANVAVQLEDIR